MVGAEDEYTAGADLNLEVAATISSGNGASDRQILDGDRRANVGQAVSKMFGCFRAHVSIGGARVLANITELSAAKRDDHRPFHNNDRSKHERSARLDAGYALQREVAGRLAVLLRGAGARARVPSPGMPTYCRHFHEPVEVRCKRVGSVYFGR